MFPKPVLSRALTGAVLAALLMTAALSTSALAGSSWTSTSTAAEKLANATSLGAAPSSTPLRIAVGLRLQNHGALDNYLRDVETPGTLTYGHFLSPTQFRDSYAPTAAQAQTVANYLSSKGFKNVQIEPNRLYVTANGSIATAQKAFNTSIGQFSQNGRTVYALSLIHI